MQQMAVVDVMGVQESKGGDVRRANGGLTTEQFLAYAEDVRDQPAGWRRGCDKADDYYDSNQIDPETMRDLQDAGMAPLVNNLIKPTIDVVLGMEAKTRTDWRVTTDADKFQDVAEALSSEMATVERETRADRACSDAYAGEVKAGIGWVEVSRQSDPFKYKYRVSNPHRREIDWDWRDRDPALQEGRYLIRRRWFDLDEAQTYFPRQKHILEAAGTGWGHAWYERMTETAELMHAFEQERGWTLEEWEYRDTIRRRICLYEVWYRQLRRGHVLKLPDSRVVEMNLDNPAHALAVARQIVRPIPAIYSKWGMAIFAGPHKMVDYGADRRRHPYIPFWGYRESLTNTPYGLIRSMISPQDEVNARRRKLMWLLSAVRLTIDSDALDKRFNSIADVLRELARPDAAIILDPARKNKDGGISIESNLQLAEAQFKIMVNAEESIQKVAGVFNALLGRDSSSTSGIAIDSLVEQGATVLAELNDNYRHSRRLVGESLLDLIREDIGNDEVEIIAGEDGRKKKSIILNQRVQDPEFGNITMLKNQVQHAGVRITLEDVPSTPSYRKQQFTMLAEVIKGLSPEAQAVLTPYLLESSDLPKRQKMAQEVRQALNLPSVDGEDDPRVMALTQQVQQLTEMLQQAQVAIEDKTKREDREIGIKERQLDLQERELDDRKEERDAKIEQMRQQVQVADAKVAEAEARAESIKADTARKDAEFALNNAVTQLGEQVTQVAGGVQQAQQKVDATQQATAQSTKQLESALMELKGALEKMQSDSGTQFDGLRKDLASVIAEETSKSTKEADERTKKAVEQAAAAIAEKQEQMIEALREELGARRDLRGVMWKKDAEGNAVGGVADYGDEKRAFTVVRGKNGEATRLEFDDEGNVK